MNRMNACVVCGRLFRSYCGWNRRKQVTCGTWDCKRALKTRRQRARRAKLRPLCASVSSAACTAGSVPQDGAPDAAYLVLSLPRRTKP